MTTKYVVFPRACIDGLPTQTRAQVLAYTYELDSRRSRKSFAERVGAGKVGRQASSVADPCSCVYNAYTAFAGNRVVRYDYYFYYYVRVRVVRCRYVCIVVRNSRARVLKIRYARVRSEREAYYYIAALFTRRYTFDAMSGRRPHVCRYVNTKNTLSSRYRASFSSTGE